MFKNQENISIYLDKINRTEYLYFPRYVKKYKITSNNTDLYYTQEKLQKVVIYTKKQKEEILKNDDLVYYELEECDYYKNVIGTLLTDFINCDFGDIEKLNKFIEKYSICLFSSFILNYNEESLIVKENNIYSKKQYEDMIQLICDKYSDELEKIKRDFINVIDYSYNNNNMQDMKDFTPFERYYVLNHSRLENDITEYSENLELDFNRNLNYDRVFGAGPKEKYVYEYIQKIEDKERLIQYNYFIKSTELSNILFISFQEIISMNDFGIKMCQNCGKYFVPMSRTDEIYCTNIFEDNMTCKQIGSKLFRKKKLQEDELARLYRNTYQQKLLLAKRNPSNKNYANDFDWFRDNVKIFKEEMKKGNKTEEDFKNWLISVKRNRR